MPQIDDERIFAETIESNPFTNAWLAIGEVVRIDPELQVCDVKWLSIPGYNSETRIGVGYRGIRSYLGVVPDVGDYVVCSFTKQGEYLGQPIILGTLFRNVIDKNSISRGYTSNKISNDVVRRQTDVSLEDRVKFNSLRTITRKIYPGEVAAWSKQGSYLNIDEGVELADHLLNNIKIDSELEATIANALSFYLSTEAGRFRFGMTMRNIRTLANVSDTSALNNKVSNNRFNNFLKGIVLPSGRRLYIPTSPLSRSNLNETDGKSGRPWVEHLIEMPEICDGILDVTEFNADQDLDNLYSRGSSVSTGGRSKGSPHEDIFIRKILGTLVGNDVKEVDKYGKVLLRQIFDKFDSTNPRTFEKQLIAATEEAEENQLASLFHLAFLKTSDFGNNKDSKTSIPTAIDITKEGVILFTVSSSSDKHKTIGRGASANAPNSGGTSIEGYIEGLTKLASGRSVKEQESFRYDSAGRITFNIGKNDSTGASIEQKTIGGIRLRVGQLASPNNDNLNLSPGPTGSAGDSLAALFEGGINLSIGKSKNGKAAVIRFQGDVELAVDGNFSLNVAGNYTESISGNSKRTIRGNLTENSRKATYKTSAGDLQIKGAIKTTVKANAQLAIKAGARIKMNAAVIMEN